jgi:hypothetical protein
METVMAIFNFIMANYQAILAAVVAILGGVIAICMMIPGPQPEAALQKVVEFLSKFSRK